MARLIILEEDMELCVLIEKVLENLGHSVTSCDGRAQFIQTLSSSSAFDLALIDVTIGGGKSLQTLLHLQKHDLPVLVITNPQSDIEAVAIELGADGCLVKPFINDVIGNVVSAVIERSQDTSVEIEVDGLSLRAEQRLVAIGPKQVKLSTTECALLEQLLLSAGSVAKKETLLTTVVGQCLEHFIQLLSRKLGRKILPVGDEGFLFVV